MADESAETPVAAKKKSSLPAIGIVVGGMLGVTVAMLLVAPRVVANRAANPAASASSGGHEPSGGGGGGHGGGGGRGGGSGEYVELGNLLVNPAGSRGLRFLMASISLEVLGNNNKAVDDLRQREAQVRDLIIGVLEQYTLDDLTGPGARDSAKHQISAVVDSVFGFDVAVFMPQFVIN